jgi:cyclase
VKGVRFEGLRDVGDPVELAVRYEREGADEIVFLDIAASREARGTLLDVVRRTAERLFVPLTVGGGVRTADDVGMVLRAGADKVSLNSAAVRRPDVLTECAARFGSQCVVASIDVSRKGEQWGVYVKGGSEVTDLDARSWATECVQRGAGEILLTSIDRDGTREGYDLPLTQTIKQQVSVPVVASGGAGSAQHVADVLVAGADAALVAGILHDGVESITNIKRVVREHALATR